MANTENSNRWWENYLVRYFMPSIAGVAILSWFASLDDGQLKQILFFGGGSGAETLTLTLLILYGNLFCYIASYPILTFHATRVIDFPNAQWKPHFLDGYIASFVLAAAVFITVFFIPRCAQPAIAFVLVIVFSLVQFLRLWVALKTKNIKGLKEPISSIAYGYTYALARQRGIQEKMVKNTNQTSDLEEGESTQESEQKTYWRREVMDTYRHLREHGNSAFIFCLELILAALCYIILSTTEDSAQTKLSMIGVLLGIWSLPAVSTHLIGQTFERRFSKFDRRLNEEKS